MKQLSDYLTESISKINKNNYEKFLKNDGMDQTLREWYKEKSPWMETDDIPNDTFAVILASLFNNPKEFSKNYCWADITETEYLLIKLAKLCHCDPECLLDFYKKEGK